MSEVKGGISFGTGASIIIWLYAITGLIILWKHYILI